ncbi:phosphate ABC transporter permease PstA [Rubrobacter marinus]|uniref:Phosphate transport system permease protein PstA n=1 Tax=Rubrobacter marinus TaxID=2653852 RepID=A0A6G8PZ50_9ACTN|nr:phosphate ABC transporter permease PstA [Rubrobacter marinus]QIN79472.1 phosphate ABC transporter permease PstA [Rubrobacter marinus]
MSESQTEVATRGSGPGEPEDKTAFKNTSNNRNLTDKLFTVLVTAAAFFGIVVLAVLLVDVFRDGLPFVDGQFLTSLSSITPENAGVYGALVGSILLIVLTALITVPIGVGAAIYLEEYAGDNFFTRAVEVTISNLAAVPSIIYGILGLGLFVNGLIVPGMGPILLAGALTLSLLVLPVIIIATREALRAVPGSVREGGIALGATRWEVTRDHVLPSALPGALTGMILALSRALGETAPLIVVGAVTFATFAPPISPEALFGRYGALPIQIYDYIQRFRPEFKDELAPAGIVVMMVVLLLVNSVAIVLRNRWQARR